MSEQVKVTLPAEDLRALFDLAVNSMDFGSGFWETSDVETARRVAVSLNVDPMEATPSTFAKKYRHAFTPLYRKVMTLDYCKWCTGREDDWQHQEEVVEG